MSFYEVRVFDDKSNLKNIVSPEQLERRHWGEDYQCCICNNFYLPKLRRGSQGVWTPGAAKTHDIKKKKDRSPEKGFCSHGCRSKHYAREKAKANPIPIVMATCHCGKEFMVKSKVHVHCSHICGQNTDRRLALARAKRLKEARILKKIKEAKKNDRSSEAVY